MAKEPLQEHLPYQVAAQVRQLLAQKADAEAIGNVTAAERADKQLRDIGWKFPERTPEVRKDAPPEGRQGRHERVETAEDSSVSKATRPRPARGSA